MLLQTQQKPLPVCEMAANPDGLTLDDINQRAYYCSGYVKMMMATVNNTALSGIYLCHDRIADIRSQESYRERPRSPHPKYRQRVKQLFMQAFKERDRYRSRLLNPLPGEVRFFSVKDLTDEQRRAYGQSLTDTQYFEFWEAAGSLVYQKSEPLIGSLWNKFRLALQQHGVQYPDIVAWGLVGSTLLELAVVEWDKVMHAVHEECNVVPLSVVKRIYQPFNLGRVSEIWHRAVAEMAPEVASGNLSEIEERNIVLGVEQLVELWEAVENPYDSLIKACEDYGEDVFATKGQVKKAIRELTEARNETTEK